MKAKYLADTSAWHWSSCVADRWVHLLEEGDVATCSIVEMEYLWSSRSKSDLVASYKERGYLEMVAMDQIDSDRAVEVMLGLGKKQEMGHRSVKMADLLIAAVAEKSDLCVLHYDEDHDKIAAITGQSTEWLAKKGSLRR